MIAVTKVSYNGKDVRTRIEWTDESGQDRTLVSRKRPSDDLVEALAALKPVVVAACLLAGDDEDLGPILDDLTVRGVTLRSLEDAEGVTITALREVGWTGAPLVLNTPFAPVDAVPDRRTERLLQRVTDEAQLFVGGKRAADEPTLFDGEYR